MNLTVHVMAAIMGKEYSSYRVKVADLRLSPDHGLGAGSVGPDRGRDDPIVEG